MSRSPLAYPLTRGIDGDSGGAADLQTDIMRFMAILSLCLVAIFALVQSLPIEAVEAPPEPVGAPPESVGAPPESVGARHAGEPEPAPVEAPPEPVAARHAGDPKPEPAQAVTLTRPKWVSSIQPREAAVETETTPAPPVAPAPEQEGFTLRFESDIALTRLVAAGHVGFYAIDSEHAQRMTVSDSRISFWEASTPNSFHEMDAVTVPRPVVDALGRSGMDSAGVSWGVTLPGKLSTQLNTLMEQHRGGDLVIQADGNLVRESGS